MKAIHFDAKTGEQLEAHEVGVSSTGFCSWGRLSEVFRAAEEVRNYEELLSFQVDERGITFRLRRR